MLALSASRMHGRHVTEQNVAGLFKKFACNLSQRGSLLSAVWWDQDWKGEF